jgi:hypothetical protein
VAQEGSDERGEPTGYCVITAESIDIDEGIALDVPSEDAAYIVAACSALPALLDRLDKAEAALSVERIAQALRVHRPLDNGTCSCRKWTFGKESLTEIFTEHQAKGVRAALTSTDKETQG